MLGLQHRTVCGWLEGKAVVSLASPLNLHHPNIPVAGPQCPSTTQPSRGRWQSQRWWWLGSGPWGVYFFFLTGLGREEAEAEQFSGIAVVLTASPKEKIGLGRGSGGGGGGGCARWGRALGTALLMAALGCRDRGLGHSPCSQLPARSAGAW